MSFATEPGRSSANLNIKRYALLGFVIAMSAVAINWMSASAQDDVKKEEYRKIAREDCSYLHSPETFRGAMASHRDLVSRSTRLTNIPKSRSSRRRTSREKTSLTTSFSTGWRATT
jgi:hypothetical protein